MTQYVMACLGAIARPCNHPLSHASRYASMRLPTPSFGLVCETSTLADLANSGPSKMAGSVTAALYLERFVPPAVQWAHLDVFAWNDTERPGKPVGGEAQGLRAAFEMLKVRCM